ncbi:ArsR/SmtB family transcription factor [Amycolatopsis cihanbeyliensis]|uniref:DNA-binding transcriptional ArsR family regulator n=1 Tax=Amycolatopsis cihanbeyliensis TaxID=1128664 RepID=A0A542DD03_AMYCI|nr:metalloregulator ArsR/SmtB family transcription factor [Amycolatopsis cihanbeyliensis]TQJ00948.1 DNA-binding transcriptional ArsR family regulator [Amycolatopsis cihanbeyliensis]
MHAFDVLGDPVRRRILELLVEGEMTSGAMCAVIVEEFGITQPAVSQHLKVLRDNGFATVRPDGARRLYAVDAEPLRDVDVWLDRFRRCWTPHRDPASSP